MPSSLHIATIHGDKPRLEKVTDLSSGEATLAAVLAVAAAEEGLDCAGGEGRMLVRFGAERFANMRNPVGGGEFGF